MLTIFILACCFLYYLIAIFNHEHDTFYSYLDGVELDENGDTFEHKYEDMNILPNIKVLIPDQDKLKYF
jgi:hypothetical protein